MTAVVRLLKPCDECGETGIDYCDSCYEDGPDGVGHGPCPSCVGGWLPDDETVEAAAKALHEFDRGTRPSPREEWRSLGEIQDYYRVLSIRALVAAARYQSEGKP